LHQKRAREFHARAIQAFSRGETRSARSSLARAAKEFRADGDRPNAALVEALIAFVEAEHARSTLAIGEAHVAASRAWAAAHRAGHASLAKEVERFEALLATPVATNGVTKLDSAAISDLLRSPNHVVVDGHRANVFSGGKLLIDLASRPMLVELLSALATGNPISSKALAAKMFGVRTLTKIHETRLRSLLTMTRKLAKGRLGVFDFHERTFCWTPNKPVVVISPLAPIFEARLESFLSRGSSHSTKSLAKRLGQSVLATKKALNALALRGTVQLLPDPRAKPSDAQASKKPSNAPASRRWLARSVLDGIGRVQLF
jgi:hypothetical protein